MSKKKNHEDDLDKAWWEAAVKAEQEATKSFGIPRMLTFIIPSNTLASTATPSKEEEEREQPSALSPYKSPTPKPQSQASKPIIDLTLPSLPQASKIYSPLSSNKIKCTSNHFSSATEASSCMIYKLSKP